MSFSLSSTLDFRLAKGQRNRDARRVARIHAGVLHRCALLSPPPSAASLTCSPHLTSDDRIDCSVGAYRLVHDPKLYIPIWQRSQRSLRRALILAVPFLLVAFPLTRLWVTLVLSRSPFSPRNLDQAAYLGISPITYTTWTLTLGQLSLLVEWMLARELKKSRNEAYQRTVQSRGKRGSLAFTFHSLTCLDLTQYAPARSG